MKLWKSTYSTAALIAGAALAGPAVAGVSGNVGVVSDYMFRGLSQSGGAAIQGGIDYSAESGLYVGTWASNINFAGGSGAGTEQDFYVGYAMEIGGVGVDVNALYYWYPEEDSGTGEEWSTLEFNLGLSFGPVSLGVAYAPELNFFAGDGAGEEGLYLSAAFSSQVSTTTTLDVSVGQYSGDELDRTLGDSYIDYAIGLTTELSDGFSASFQYIATDIDDDDPKFVVGLSKSFEM